MKTNLKKRENYITTWYRRLTRIPRFRSSHSHYEVILIVTSFATELATPTVTDTLPRLIYKDFSRYRGPWGLLPFSPCDV